MSVSVSLSQFALPAVISLNNFFIEKIADGLKPSEVADQLALCAAKLGVISAQNVNVAAQWRCVDTLSKLLNAPQLPERRVSDDIMIRGVMVALRQSKLLSTLETMAQDVKRLMRCYDEGESLPAVDLQHGTVGSEIGGGESAHVYQFIAWGFSSSELAIQVFNPGYGIKALCTLALAPYVYDVGMFDDGRYYIIVPRFGEALDHKIHEMVEWPEARKLQETLKIVDACAGEYKRGVVHGDLRAPNILSRDASSYVVVDHGNSQFCDSTETSEVYHPCLHYENESSRELREGETAEQWHERHRDHKLTLDPSVDVLYLGTTLLEVFLNIDITFDLLKKFHRDPSSPEFKVVPNCLKSILWTATQSSGQRYKNLSIMKDRIHAAIEQATRASSVAAMALSATG